MTNPAIPGADATPVDPRERLARLRERPVVLSVEGLGRRFRSPSGEERTALDAVSFQVHRREFTTVIGPSGCGKSTLVRLLAGLDEPSAGTVRVDGTPVRGPGPDRGMVFQGYTLFPWRTVLKNVMFGPEMAGAGHDEARRQALQWLEVVGLERFADLYPHQLSGGMKQRVAIARALANKPRILFMDEPFAALDPHTRAQMQGYLLQLWANVPITIVFITHDLDEAVLLADRVVVLGSADAQHPGGHLRTIVDVPLPRPRGPEILDHPDFLAVRRDLDELVHPKRPAIEVEPLPMIRFAQVGDEV